MLDCVDTARRAPETFEEALAVMKGERPVKPDYERAVSTVSAVRFFSKQQHPNETRLLRQLSAASCGIPRAGEE